MVTRYDEHRLGVADALARGAQRVAGAERLLLDRDGNPVERARCFGREDDDERIRAERPHGFDDPVDEPAPEQRVQVLRRRGLHPRAEPGRHDDGCQFAMCHQSWGARIRTWDRGTKTRCLTTWLRPTAGGSLGAPSLGTP